MEKRKIVRSGNTSHTIALPIHWIRKNDLGKGSFIDISENEFGELILATEKTDEKIEKNKLIVIKIDGGDFNKTRLELIHAYYRDYKTIQLEGKDINKVYEKIILEIKTLIGLDIIEKNQDSIIIKNFSSEDEELSPRILMRKMDIGIRSMFDSIRVFFESGLTNDDLFELKSTKEQNERIYSLMRKTILKCIENPHLLRKYQVSFHQLSKDKMIAGMFNNISSMLESIGSSFLYLEHKKKDMEIIREIFDSIEKEFVELMSIMRYKNYKDVFDIITKHDSKKTSWDSSIKRMNNPIMIESMTFLIVINDILHKLAFEIIE
jgi:phosphate uptake regulator|tara:strand:- start:3216 stop:4178 length:963 start_codon:yes stop_codon:yes gene_type:complete